jgi:hypothetical protein
MYSIRNTTFISGEDQDQAWRSLCNYGGILVHDVVSEEVCRALFASASDPARTLKDHYQPIFQQGEDTDVMDPTLNTRVWPRWMSHISLEEFNLESDFFPRMVDHVVGQREEMAGLYSDKTVFLYSVGSTVPVFQRTHADFCADTPEWFGDSVPLSLVLNIDQKDAILRFYPYSIKGAAEDESVVLRHEDISIQPRSGFLFRGDAIHCGAGYEQDHYRAHTYMSVHGMKTPLNETVLYTMD